MDETLLRAQRVIEAHERGVMIADACDAEGIGCSQFYHVLRRHPELMQRRDEARMPWGQLTARELIRVADDSDVKRARNKMAALMWLLERTAPDEFGQKLTTKHEVAVSLLGPRIDQAAQVLNAPSDYLTHEQKTQAIDVTPTLPPASPDRKSVAPPAEPNAVDIFED